MSSTFEVRGVETRLDGHVAEVADGHEVFEPVGQGSEVDPRRQMAAQRLPSLQEPVVDRVELVGVGENVLEPEPLDHRRFQQRGGRVGVVLQEFRRLLAVVGQVEAAVDRRLVLVPRIADIRPELRRDQKAVQERLVGQHVLDGRQAGVVQGVGGLLQGVDFRRAELVTDALVPIRVPVGRVIVQPLRLDDLGPILPARGALATHQEMAPWPEPPKPPRTDALELTPPAWCPPDELKPLQVLGVEVRGVPYVITCGTKIGLLV